MLRFPARAGFKQPEVLSKLDENMFGQFI